MEDKLREIINNIEQMRENFAGLKLGQDKDELVLYGDKDIRLPGLLERVENMEIAVKTLVETDKSRQSLIKGIMVGFAFQGGGILAILAKVFS